MDRDGARHGEKNRRPGPAFAGVSDEWRLPKSAGVSARLINVESVLGEEGRELKNETNTEV